MTVEDKCFEIAKMCGFTYLSKDNAVWNLVYWEQHDYYQDWENLMRAVNIANHKDLWEEWDISHLATCLVSADIQAAFEELALFAAESNKH